MDIEGRRGVFVPEGEQGVGSAPAPPASVARPTGGTTPGGSGNATAGAPAAGPARPTRRARFVEVKTGIDDGDYIEITNGLTEGQSIVTTGAAALRDGDFILLAGPRGGRTAQQPGQPPPDQAGSPRASGQQAQRTR
jgi:hypothetical protein